MNQLRVGASKICITPPKELLPFPRFLDYAFEEVLDDVYVRTVVVDNGDTKFLILCLDSPPSPDAELKEKIADKFGFEKDKILATNTQNHSCPHWGSPRATGIGLPPAERIAKMEAYTETVESGIFEAVEQALSSLKPAKYGYGEGKSYISVNRDEQFEDGSWMQGQNHAGPSDKTLAIMKFEDYDGNLIAAIANYGCHGTTAYCVKDTDGKIKLTPGFMGYAASYVERRYGKEAVVLWTSGAGADQNPLFSSEGFPRVYEDDGYSESSATPPGTQYIIQRHHGYTHAKDIIMTLKEIKAAKNTMSILTASTAIELDGQRAPEGADVMLNRLMVDNMVRIQRPELCIDGKPPKKELLKMIPDGKVPLKMQMAILGDVAFIGVAAELYCEIGMKLKEASPFKNTVVITHTDRDTADYVLSDASAHHTVFQSFAPVRPGNNDTPILQGANKMFEEAQ